MATIKKAQKGKKVSPTYKNLPMGVKNEQYQMTGVSKDVTPSSKDSARYRGGFEQGLKGKKGAPNEGNVEKMGRWEGQNATKKKGKMGIKVVKKAQKGVTQNIKDKRGMAKGDTSTYVRKEVPDTSGFAAGRTRFPEKITTSKGTVNTFTNRYGVKDIINNPTKSAINASSKKSPLKNKTGGTLSPSKKSVGKTIGKLNKAKSGMKMGGKKKAC